MSRKSICWLSGVVMALVFLSGLEAWAQNKSGAKAPVITNAFTVEKIKYGDILKVYIEAEDPLGEMLRIATVVEQAGSGSYPTSWVYVKPADRKHLRGYLQWNTYSSKAPFVSEGTPITLTVSVFDKAGRQSNAYAFPITFESGVKPASSYQVPSPFDKGDVRKLGVVDVDLIDFTIWRK